MNQIKENLLNDAKEIEKELIEIRRELHANPEIGFDLENTVRLVKTKLKEYGYEPQDCGKAGVVATIGNGEGKTFLLRGDMDALEIVEDTDLEFKSTNGRMHACGHDTHTTMLLGAAKLLKKYEASIKGTVKLMFQPAEEIMLGAQDMINSGLLENPKVDAGSMIHIAPGLPFDDGVIAISPPGKSLSSSDWFEIIVVGKGGHGSMPHATIDPLVPASNIHMALHEIQSRELPADSLVSLTIGEFIGGTTSNVIPDRVTLKGTLRTYDDDMRGRIKERMQEIAEHIALAYRAEAKVNFLAGCPTLENDEAIVAHADTHLADYLGQDKVVSLSQFPAGPVEMGSEDFAYLSHKIPTVMFSILAADSRKSTPLPLHHPQLVVSEDILVYGASAHTAMAISWLDANS